MTLILYNSTLVLRVLVFPRVPPIHVPLMCSHVGNKLSWGFANAEDQRVQLTMTTMTFYDLRPVEVIT
jgi:hypothetical protein